MSVGDNVAYWIESGIGVKFQSRHVEQGKVIALDGDHLQIQPGSSGRCKAVRIPLHNVRLHSIDTSPSKGRASRSSSKRMKNTSGGSSTAGIPPLLSSQSPPQSPTTYQSPSQSPTPLSPTPSPQSYYSYESCTVDSIDTASNNLNSVISLHTFLSANSDDINLDIVNSMDILDALGIKSFTLWRETICTCASCTEMLARCVMCKTLNDKNHFNQESAFRNIFLSLKFKDHIVALKSAKIDVSVHSTNTNMFRQRQLAIQNLRRAHLRIRC